VLYTLLLLDTEQTAQRGKRLPKKAYLSGGVMIMELGLRFMPSGQGCAGEKRKRNKISKMAYK
jgi:hypothetical protein